MSPTMSEWIRCPICGSKTRLQIRKDTELKNFPLFCPKCKQETLINVIISGMSAVYTPSSKRFEGIQRPVGTG